MERENWTAKGEAWRLHADLSRKRAAIVRKVAGMMRGSEPLPDGLTRAALVVCGTAWRGFDWTRRGVEVSPAVWESERNAATAALASRSVEVAREAGKVSDAFHAADALAALRGESLTPPAEWTSPALERLRPIRDAVAGCLDALNEEGEAWRDFEAAYLDAREAVPVEEIEAARARLAAEDAAATAPLRVAVSGPVEVEGVRAVAENAAAAALAAKQGAQEARRTREAVEQQGAAVVGAVREVGAKVEQNGKAKPPAGRGTGKRGKRAAIKIEVAAAYMKKGTRTLQRWEKNPGLVPDEWAGYSRAVRMTRTDWETWKVSLGMREGTQGQLRNAAKRLGDGWSSTHTTRR